VIHEDITCDVCGLEGIVGIRYKCSVCNDYDLCERCEAVANHPHPFLKIRHPSQAPFKIIVIMNDEQEESFYLNGRRHPMCGFRNLIHHGMNFAQQFMAQNFEAPKEQEKKEAPKEQQKEEKI